MTSNVTLEGLVMSAICNLMLNCILSLAKQRLFYLHAHILFLGWKRKLDDGKKRIIEAGVTLANNECGTLTHDKVCAPRKRPEKVRFTVLSAQGRTRSRRNFLGSDRGDRNTVLAVQGTSKIG